MIQPRHFLNSCPNFVDSSSLDDFGCYELGMDAYVKQFDGFHAIPSMEFLDFQVIADEMLVDLPVDDESLLNLEELEKISNGEIEDLNNWLFSDCNGEYFASSPHQLSNEREQNNDEWSFMISVDSSVSTSSQKTLNIPLEGMEIDNQIGLIHLAKAFGEATEIEQADLAEAIKERIRDKASPLGEASERLLHYLFRQSKDKEAEWLNEECDKNSEAALKAFYQIFPYGMFAHFTANSAILEAKPHNAEFLHVVDFDIGDGLQWSSMITAIAQREKKLNQRATLKITSVKWKEEEEDDFAKERFEKTKRRLHSCARSSGVKLKVDEMEFQDLESEMKITERRCGERQFLVFNCMWSLPHMGRRRSRSQFIEFISAAKDLLAKYTTNSNGVITIGDGDAWEKSKNCRGFGSLFGSYLEHYRSLLESIEHNFSPVVGLTEARIAMECLFVAPFVSCVDWKQMAEERNEGTYYDFEYGLKGFGLSNECLLEAKELVREGESLYGVRIEGSENVNEMVLEWKGTPLVRVSAWRSQTYVEKKRKTEQKSNHVLASY